MNNVDRQARIEREKKEREVHNADKQAKREFEKQLRITRWRARQEYRRMEQDDNTQRKEINLLFLRRKSLEEYGHDIFNEYAICPKCSNTIYNGYNIRKLKRISWCKKCVGWIAPSDLKWVPRPVCKYCGVLLATNFIYCPVCGKKI